MRIHSFIQSVLMLFLFVLSVFISAASAVQQIEDSIWILPEMKSYDKCQKQYASFSNRYNLSLESNDIIQDKGFVSAYGPSLWKGAHVAYELADSFSYDERKQLACSFLFFRDNTCIRFEPKTSSDKDILSIRNSGSGCYSYVGSIGGRQTLNLQSGCFYAHGTPIHEMMHALGLNHEQCRSDRDKYVDVHFENIEDAYEGNYRKSSAKIVGNYDYLSVMHYPTWGFNIDGKPTMTAKLAPIEANTKKMGQRNKPTQGDIDKLNELYSCKSDGGKTTQKPTTTTTRKTTITKPEPDCKDGKTGCPGWQKHCGNNSYVDRHCKKTCGTCGLSTTTTTRTTRTTRKTTTAKPNPDCKNTDDRCENWKRYCGPGGFMGKNCKKTCGYC